MPERRINITVASVLLSAVGSVLVAGTALAADPAEEKAPLTAPAVATPEAVSAQKWMNEGKPSAEVDLKALAAEQAAKGREAAPAEFDPQANSRLYEVSRQLRCLVCANESIAESNAELAVDLRNQVIEQVKAGKTNKEIIDYMVERYGDFVLYRPPFKSTTYILWIGPIALFLIGLGAFYVNLRRRKRVVASEAKPLTADEQALAADLLGEKKE